MGRVVKYQNCQFMLVCDDAFESNLVDRKTVARAMETLKEVSVPVHILPGNHDPLNEASGARQTDHPGIRATFRRSIVDLCSGI